MIQWTEIGNAGVQTARRAGRSLEDRLLRIILKKRIVVPSLFVLTVFMAGAEIFESADSAVERERITAYIDHFDPRYTPAAERERLVKAILNEAPRLEIPPHMQIEGRPINKVYFLTAFVRVESGFYPRAVSTSNALGYMQLKMSTVRWLDSKRGSFTHSSEMFRARKNVALGVDYLNTLFAEMSDPREVTLAYNAGPNNVRRGVYIEDYWQKVLRTYRLLRSGEFAELDRFDL